MNQEEAEKRLIQNLKDAGCTSDVIELFITFHEQDDTPRQIRVLSKHRSLLLNRVHDSQKKLDCLDYLLYKIKKEQSCNDL